MQDSKPQQARLRDELIINPEGRHYRAMGKAVWLYLYFVLSNDHVSGELATTMDTMTAAMGISKRTIERWLRRLKDKGYIRTKSNGRLIIVEIQNLRAITSATNLSPQSRQNCHPRDDKFGSSRLPATSQKEAETSQKAGTSERERQNCPIDISIKNKLNIDIDEESHSWPQALSPFDGLKAQTREELLAIDLARTLDDLPGLPLYLSYARKYPEHFLRKILGTVKEIPPQKVKRSRGALFNFLVQKHGKPHPHNPGN